MSSAKRFRRTSSKFVARLFTSSFEPRARPSIAPVDNTFEIWMTVPAGSSVSPDFFPSSRRAALVTTVTLTEFGQKIVCSLIDLKSRELAAGLVVGSTMATGETGTGAVTTGAGLSWGTGTGASGATAAGRARGLTSVRRGSFPGARLTATEKPGANKKTAVAPTAAPTAKSRNPLKKAAMEIRSRL